MVSSDAPRMRGKQVAARRVRQAREAGPVVYEDRFLAVERPVEHAFELPVGVLGRGLRGGVDRHVPLGERGGDIVLDKERPGARHRDIRAGLGEHHRQVGGLGLYGQGDADAQALEDAVLEVLVAYAVQDRRVLGGPVDLLVSLRGEGRILDVGRALHGGSPSLD